MHELILWVLFIGFIIIIFIIVLGIRANIKENNRIDRMCKKRREAFSLIADHMDKLFNYK